MTKATSTRKALACLAGATLLIGGLASPQLAGADESLVWQEITFGQSVDLSFSSNVLPEKVGVNYADPSVPGTIEGDIFMESRGGKLAPGHDGLTMYYVDVDPREHNFVLSADVLVHQLGPETGANRNGQEGAGLMVRDLNGAPRQDPMIPGFEEYPAASNFASTLMMRNGPASMVRTGTLAPWGTLGSTRPSTAWARGACVVTTGVSVNMVLERTDTDFVMSASWTGTDGSECSGSTIHSGADVVQVQDPGNMTVGFFAARNAAVTFSNASISLSPANTVPSPPAPETVRPFDFETLSPQHASTTDYIAAFRSTHPGALSLTANGDPVLTEIEMPADEVASHPVGLQPGRNELSATFTADEGPDTRPRTLEWSVDVREFPQMDLVVAPDGTPDGDGTQAAPLDLQTAVNHIAPGHSVLMADGTYDVTSNVVIGKGYRGVEGAVKTLAPIAGADVVLDGEQGSASRIIMLEADHWHLKGFTTTRSNANGVRVSGSHNVIEQMVFNFNGDTGFQLSGSSIDPLRWPAHNLVLNSESHDNRDASDINADGFAAKLGVGPGNVFRGNVAHHNIDDGWDFYNRLNEGANFPITLDGNIAHSNGFLSDGYNLDGGTGNGFKLGGEGLPVAHVVTNNLAYGNNMDGFTDNFNPGRMQVSNNTAVDNGRYNFLFRASPYFADGDQSILRNTVSLSPASDRPRLPDATAADLDATNYLWDGSRTISSHDLIVRNGAEFVTLRLHDGHQRAADGSLDWGTYAQPKWNSFLTRAGVDGGHVGAVPPQVKPGRGNPNPPGQR